MLRRLIGRIRAKSPKTKYNKRLLVGRVTDIKVSSKEKPQHIAYAVVPHPVHVEQNEDGTCPLCGENHSP